MADKVKFGFSQVYYAMVEETLTNGQYTYEFGTPKALPGGVSLTLSASGDRTPFRADNIDYWVGNANSGYEGTLTMAELPMQFLADVLGMSKDNGDGTELVESANDTPKPFALLYQVEGDTNARRHVFYYCVASRPDVNAETTDTTITPTTDALPFTAMPLKDSTKYIKTSVAPSSGAYSTFFTNVYVPTSATPPQS